MVDTRESKSFLLRFFGVTITFSHTSHTPSSLCSLQFHFLGTCQGWSVGLMCVSFHLLHQKSAGYYGTAGILPVNRSGSPQECWVTPLNRVSSSLLSQASWCRISSSPMPMGVCRAIEHTIIITRKELHPYFSICEASLSSCPHTLLRVPLNLYPSP